MARRTDPDWKHINEALWERSHGWCERCGNVKFGSPDGGQRHHRRLRSQGGLHVVPNLLLICQNCHVDVHMHPLDSRQMGYLVSGWGRDTDQVPVVHAWYGRVLLLEDGGVTHPGGPSEPEPITPEQVDIGLKSPDEYQRQRNLPRRSA